MYKTVIQKIEKANKEQGAADQKAAAQMSKAKDQKW
jgi:hypothetical protein